VRRSDIAPQAMHLDRYEADQHVEIMPRLGDESVVWIGLRLLQCTSSFQYTPGAGKVEGVPGKRVHMRGPGDGGAPCWGKAGSDACTCHLRTLVPRSKVSFARGLFCRVDMRDDGMPEDESSRIDVPLASTGSNEGSCFIDCRCSSRRIRAIVTVDESGPCTVILYVY
jgi:hypothetical protein